MKTRHTNIDIYNKLRLDSNFLHFYLNIRIRVSSICIGELYIFLALLHSFIHLHFQLLKMAQAKNDKLYKLLDSKKFDYTKYKTLKDDIESGKVRMELVAECNDSDLNKLLDQHKVVDIMERKSFIVAIKSSHEWKQVQGQQQSNGM